MSSRASRRKDIVDVVKNIQGTQRKQAGMARQNFSGLASADFGGVTSSASSGSGSTSTSVNTTGLLRMSGDTMIGAISFYPVTIAIASGAVDIGDTSGQYTSNIILIGEGGAADGLDTISNPTHSGQVLFLQSHTTTSITLNHGTGNIWIYDGVSYVMTSGEVVTLLWDATNSRWNLVGNYSAGAGGGTGMQNPSIADLNMASWDVIGVDRLQFVQDAGAVISTSAPTIYVSSASSQLVFNNNSNDFVWTHTNVTSMTESLSTLKKQNITAPTFTLYNSRTAATGNVAYLSFNAKETGTGEVAMATIYADTESFAVGTGDGSLHIYVRKGGSDKKYVEINDGDGDKIDLLADVNFNSFDLSNVDRLQFVQSAGSANGITTPQIYISGSDSQMVFNNNTKDFVWTHSNSTSMTESTSALKKENTTAPSFVLYNSRTAAAGDAAYLGFNAKETGTGEVAMATIMAQTESFGVGSGTGSLHLIARQAGADFTFITMGNGATGIDYFVPSGDTHRFYVAGSMILNVSDQGLNMYAKELDFDAGGRIDLSDNATTIGSNGAADALTANPVGYAKIKINGVERQIPYYSVA